MQALKLANDVVAQLSKMATRNKELEEDKLKVKEAENKLAIAVQEKELAEQALLAEKLTRQTAEKEVEALRAKIVELQNKELNPGAFARVLMKKIRKTKSFSVLMAEMCTVSTNVGIHTALVNVHNEYPELKLKKRDLGWDPYAANRVDLLQQQLCQDEREFPLVDELAKQQGPVSLEQLEAMTADYDSDLDKAVGPTPDEYVCEDDEDSGPRHDNPGSTSNQADPGSTSNQAGS